MPFPQVSEQDRHVLDDKYATLQRSTMYNEVEAIFRERDITMPQEHRLQQAHVFFQSRANGDPGHFIDWSIWLTAYSDWMPGVHRSFEALVSRLWAREILHDSQQGSLLSSTELAQWSSGCGQPSRRQQEMCELFSQLDSLRRCEDAHGAAWSTCQRRDEGHNAHGDEDGAEDEDGRSSVRLLVGAQQEVADQTFPHARAPQADNHHDHDANAYLKHVLYADLDNSNSVQTSNYTSASPPSPPANPRPSRCRCHLPDCRYETQSSSHLQRHLDSVHKQGRIYVCPYHPNYCRARTRKLTSTRQYWDTRADNFRRHIIKCHDASGFSQMTAAEQRELIDGCKRLRSDVDIPGSPE